MTVNIIAKNIVSVTDIHDHHINPATTVQGINTVLAFKPVRICATPQSIIAAAAK